MSEPSRSISTDLVMAMREWADSLNAEHYQGTVHLLRKGADEIERLKALIPSGDYVLVDHGDVIESPAGEFVLWADYERLRETTSCPRLTITAPTEQITAVLRDWDKGLPVNSQDLINALAWRLNNQRREIARLNEALRRKASDEAPSFSPNFDERNGIR